MSDTIYRFSTASDRPFATHLLVFIADRLLDGCSRLDFTDAMRMGGYKTWSCDSNDNEEDDHSHFSFEVGEGVHRFMYEECLIEATVSIHASETVKDIIKFNDYSATHVAKQISIAGVLDAEQMKRLLSDASKHAAAILRQDKEKRRSANFVYNAKDDFFAKMGYLQHRTKESLFLKEGEVDTIFNIIDDFLKSKAEYQRCAVPYKLNILLHGIPGSGKTSVITTVASHFGLNVAIIPFTSNLADDTLAKGLRRAAQLNCRLIALEDVDCLFEHARKPHDSAKTRLTLSGLLNCMDGLLRGGADGLIMFLTANMTNEIDEAMLRTARVDLSMAFTHADRFQARGCFMFYSSVMGWEFTTEEEWEAFWERIACFQFSTALLQQYFFQGRRNKAQLLNPENFKRAIRTTGKEALQDKEKKGWFYT